MSGALFALLALLPLALGVLSLFWKNDVQRNVYDLSLSVTWLIFCFYMVFYTYTNGPSNFSWEPSSFLNLTLTMRTTNLNILLITLNSVLLVLNIIFINKKTNERSFPFFFLGLINGAIMVESLYGFFIITELIFLTCYIYSCRVGEEGKSDLSLARYSNLLASALFFSMILYLGEKSYRLTGSFNLEVGTIKSLGLPMNGLFSPQGLLFLGMVFYFFIKLSILPFFSWTLGALRLNNITDNILISNATPILFIYGFKKYAMGIFPELFAQYGSYIAFVCVLIFLHFQMLSILAGSLVENFFLMRSASIGLMVGALLAQTVEVDHGVYTLLISQIFSLISLYVLTHEGNLKDISEREFLLLIVTFYALMFFPLSGNFVGFYKIVLGYKNINIYLPMLILLGLGLALVNVINLYLFVQEERKSDQEVTNIGKRPVLVSLICLFIVFFIGIRPVILDNFLSE